MLDREPVRSWSPERMQAAHEQLRDHFAERDKERAVDVLHRAASGLRSILQGAPRESINPALAPENNALPNPELHRGDYGQFSRTEPITDTNHQRRSPGDNAVS